MISNNVVFVDSDETMQPPFKLETPKDVKTVA